MQPCYAGDVLQLCSRYGNSSIYLICCSPTAGINCILGNGRMTLTRIQFVPFPRRHNSRRGHTGGRAGREAAGACRGVGRDAVRPDTCAFHPDRARHARHAQQVHGRRVRPLPPRVLQRPDRAARRPVRRAAVLHRQNLLPDVFRPVFSVRCPALLALATVGVRLLSCSFCGLKLPAFSRNLRSNLVCSLLTFLFFLRVLLSMFYVAGGVGRTTLWTDLSMS